MKTNQLILTASTILILATTLRAQELPESATSCPGFAPGTPCTWQTPYCGDDCGNTPFCYTNCSTTDSSSSGSETELLYCEKAAYANCHYSGPPWATGTNSDNIPLPCELNADNTVANCKCPVFEGPSYVHMNYIFNLGVYYETVAVCGEDGSNCQNTVTCPPGTTGKCKGGGEVPPVCKYIAQQNPNDPEVSLYPGADLISTYGYGMDSNYPDVAPTSTTCNNMVVANCMTAACRYEDGDANSSSGDRYAQCACPTMFVSSFTLSQDGQICNLPEGYVWE